MSDDTSGRDPRRFLGQGGPGQRGSEQMGLGLLEAEEATPRGPALRADPWEHITASDEAPPASRPLRARPEPLLAADDGSEQEADDIGIMPRAYGSAPFDEDPYARRGDRPRQRRRWLPMAVAGLALVGFAAVVAYAYDWATGSSPVTGNPPIIAAPAGPDKTKPVEPGGIEVPNQNAQVLNPGAGQKGAEVLLPPPEEPVAPPAPPAPPPALTEAPTIPAPPDAAAVETPAVPTAPAAEAGVPAAEAGAQAGQPAPLVSGAPTPPVETAAVQPSAPAGSIAAGDFLIQLASLTSADAAKGAWSSLQKKYPDLLGSLGLSVQEAKIDGKGTFYRVQAGPLPNRATADDVCAQLKSQKQDCIVVKR